VESRTTVRYWAALKEAAGTAEEPVTAADLASLLELVRRKHAPRFGQVLDVCSFLVDGEPVGGRDHAGVALGEGAVVDCLPPFAGG
jgi:molybdopterin converting factor small subunit